MHNTKQVDFINKQFYISVNRLAPCLLHVFSHFPTKATLPIRAIDTLCLAGLALDVDFPVEIKKSFTPSLPCHEGAH